MDNQKAIELLESLSEYPLTQVGLSSTKLTQKIETMMEELPSIASVSVYPSMVDDAGVALGNSSTPVVALCGAFPSGQTYLEVKLLEIAMAIENGADEVEVLIGAGEALEGRVDAAGAELRIIAEEIAESSDTILRVNLAVGALGGDLDLLRELALEAIDAGAQMLAVDVSYADGVLGEELDVVVDVVAKHYSENAQIVGLKLNCPSSQKAHLEVLTKIEETLGEQWLNSEYLRIERPVQ